MSLMAANAAFSQDWSRFDKPPLTVLIPEAEALMNPPLLHWQAHPDAAAYELRLSGAATLGPWKTPFNFFTPEKPISAGLYRVVVFALDETGNEIDQSAHEFTVKEPTTSDIPAMNRIERRADASVYATKAQLDVLRRAEGETGELLARLKKTLDETPYHLQGEVTEPARYPEGKFEFATWQKNNSLCFTIEDRVIGATYAWQLTGEAKYLAEAKKYALLVSDWDPTGATGVWENDHSAQALLHALGVFYDAAKQELSDAERAKIREAIRARCVDVYGMLNPFVAKETAAGMMMDPNNNHPWFSASSLGIGALAIFDEDPRAEEWVAYTAQVFWGWFLPRGCRDGGWHEGIDYWSYTLFFVFQVADALQAAADVDLYQHPWLRNTALFKIYTHPPVGAYVPFGDCKHHPPNAFDKLIMMRLASVHDDAMAWKYVDAIPETLSKPRELPYALLWSDRSGAAGKPLPEIPPVVHFRDIGWIVANTDPFDEEKQLVFAFRSGPFFGLSFGHAHADQNSFVYAMAGEKLLWDAGYYDSYLSPHHRHYSRLSDAHNTILVNGTGQQVHIAGLDGRVAAFESDGVDLSVTGDASAPLIYGGRLVHFHRTVDLRDGGRTIIVSDDVWARELSQFSFLLHSEYPITFTPGKNEIVVHGHNYELIGRFESEERIEAVTSSHFPVEPKLTSHVLDDKKDYPGQFHLELRTVDKIERWKPVMTLELRRKE